QPGQPEIEVFMARWAAIVGARGTGKSTHANQVVHLLKRHGICVGGFFQQATEDELGRRSYDLHRLSTGEVLALARPTTGQELPGHTTYCSFSFVDAAFVQARQWVEQELGSHPVIVIDEVSKVEVSGQGHHDAIRCALGASDDTVVVLCIRADQLFYVVEKFELEDEAIGLLQLPASDEDIVAFVTAIAPPNAIDQQHCSIEPYSSAL
ncbi:MAG TPA: nucleoside-triphosphatase, partial [Polyangiaceae bacterium]|nr:nucleoside-triphosphatase [Polyangiaceae bacterium]